MDFNISDIVLIKGDENNELWEITNIFNGYVHLKGKTNRSIIIVTEKEIEKAEQDTIDMKLKERTEYVDFVCSNFRFLERTAEDSKNNTNDRKTFDLPGKILHLDTDKNYLDNCLKLYNQNNIPAIGYNMEPKEMPMKVIELLKTHDPDILVITGHDRYEISKDPNDVNSYVNSKYFVQAVVKARTFEQDMDSLIIFSGACSSFFEALISVGANFASSPKRIEIGELDPAIIACQIALTPILQPINLIECIENTHSKFDGIGGIQTEGTLKLATFPTLVSSKSDKVDSQMRIVIDSGHSSIGNIKKSNVDSRSAKNEEYDINFNIGLKLKEQLESNGFEVIMTKSKPNEYLSSTEIAKVGNESNADLVIKLHCNRDSDKNTNGAFALVPYQNQYNRNTLYKQSKLYGQTIIKEYCSEIGIKNRGLIDKNNLMTFNLSKVPVVLIGMGFLSNTHENSILSDEYSQQKVAKAIAKGIIKCFTK